MERNSENPPRKDDLFLPDFCGIPMVFTVVVVAELLAFLLLLTETPGTPMAWEDLGMLSLFIQWITLSSTALLCISRKYLARLGDRGAGLISYAIVLLVTLGASELAYQLFPATGTRHGPDWHMDFVLRNLGISALIGAVVLRVIYLQHQQQMHIRAQGEARIQALQARIRPHFLFNSMNTIAALIRSQPDKAEQAVEDLSDLFRASLAQADRMVTLEEEIELARHYLQIEQLRLGDRLSVDWQLGDLPLDYRIPPLILQPLLENAIYHGIEGLAQGGTILVSGQKSDGRILLRITNPCQPRPANHRNGNRIAMDNIRERIQIAFGSQASLTLDRREELCHVDLCFPEKVNPA